MSRHHMSMHSTRYLRVIHKERSQRGERGLVKVDTCGQGRGGEVVKNGSNFADVFIDGP